MADDLSLLFRLKAENTQAKAVMADTRAAVNQLRQSFGPQLTQTLTVANQTFSGLDGSLQNFVAQRVPLVGGAIVQITDRLRSLGGESAKADKAFSTLTRSLQSIASQSGKSVPQVASFLTRFVQLEGQAKRNEAAFQFFGGSVDLIGNKTAKFIPELEHAGTALATVSAESAVAGSSLAAMAGPIAIAVLGAAALVAGFSVVTKQLVDLTKHAAAFQGRLHDLAQEVNLTVSTLSAFEVLTKRTGGELGTITQAVVLFQRKLDDAQNPLSKTAELFRKFNISTADTETSLRDAFNALAAMPEGFAQTNAAAELFGARGGKQVLAILKEAGGDIDGAIKRLRELGILISEDAARSADKLNDELELLNFQMRALGAAAAEDLIPVLTDIVRSLGGIVRAVQPVVSVFGSLLSKVLFPVTKAFQGLSVVVAALTGDYKALAEAIKEASNAPEIKPIKVSDQAVPLPAAPSGQQAASEAVNQADVVLAAVKRKVSEQNQALDSQFQQGRINRDKEAKEIIAGNKQVLEAGQQRIDALLRQKEQEIKSLDEAQVKRGEIVRRDTDDYRSITAEIVKLQQERLDKESEFDVSARAIRAKAAKENADADREQSQVSTDSLIAELDKQIRIIEGASKRRAQIEPTTFGDLAERLKEERKDFDQIQLLERAKLDFRKEGLGRQRGIGNLTVEEQRKINNQIDRLNQEANHLAQEHVDRRIEIALDEVRRFGKVAQLLIDAQVAKADASIQVGAINDRARIASIQSLAKLRVKTEEQAEREILAVRLEAIDREKALADVALGAISARNEAEIEAIRARRQGIEIEINKASAVEDPALRLRRQIELRKEQTALVNAEIEALKRADAEKERAEADHNNKIRVLNAERSAIQQQGNRDIDDGRQRDLSNERAYADQLEDIRERIRRVERETAETVVRSLRDHFASRRDIVRAQTQQDLDEEKERHRQVEDRLRELERENRESKKTQQQKLDFEKEINRLREAEAERHRLAIEEKKARGKKDEINAGPFGGLVSGLATGQLTELQNGVQSFADVATVAFSAVGAVVNQLASGIGNLVQNFVLLGSNGPNAFRKLVASVLAGVAAQAATMAIMELAYGIAALTPWGAAIYGPAPFHFKAAALFGSIATIAGIAGRGVAGGLFQQSAASADAGTRSGSNSGSRNNERDPIDLTRSQQVQVLEIRLHAEPGARFNDAIVTGVVDSVRSNGPMRTVIKEVTEG